MEKMFRHFFCNYKILSPDERSLLPFIQFPKSSTQYFISCARKLFYKKVVK